MKGIAMILMAAFSMAFADHAQVSPTAQQIQARMEAMTATPERQAFISTLQGRKVVLKESLYSVIDSDPENPNIRFGQLGTTSVARGLVHLHFPPTNWSWPNQAELWFGKVERPPRTRRLNVVTDLAHNT
jgi:hypothetical protein